MQQIEVRPRKALQQRLDVTQPTRANRKPEDQRPEGNTGLSSNGLVPLSSPDALERSSNGFAGI